MWFSNIAGNENPGRTELKQFVHGVRGFLVFVLEDTRDFGFLWENHPELHKLALDTFRFDIAEGAVLRLVEARPEIPEEQLELHGLTGRPQHFKLRVLDSISQEGSEYFDTNFSRHKLRERFSAREWFKRMVAAIDAILDSLIDAAGGAGGLIKEFKDALSALA